MNKMIFILLFIPGLLFSQNQIVEQFNKDVKQDKLVKVEFDVSSAIGQIWIDTIKGNWVTFVAGCDYDIDMMNYERIIFKDGVIMEHIVIDCDVTDRYFGDDKYFESGHTYEIVIVNPATRKVIYLPCKFAL